MKTRKLAPFLAVVLSLELMVAPILPHVYAQSTQPPAPKANKISPAEAMNIGLQAAGNIWGMVSNNMRNGMTPQLASDMQKLQEQQTPSPDKYFSAQKLSQIPGLANYLALNNINPAALDCKTLPTTLHDAQPEVCRLGIINDKGLDQSTQLNHMFTYYNQYFQVSKMYKNFSADSNSEGQAFGVGCMNNAMNILNGFFKYRTDELDKLVTNLEAMNNQFREASRTDLDALEESIAVLDGNSPLADKVRGKKPDLFDFGKRFNNPACNSMFAGDSLNDMGIGGGLNSINKNIKTMLNDKQGGKYSGSSYSLSHAAVVEDINAVADKIGKQLELNFSSASGDPRAYSEFLKGMPGLVSSSTRVQDSITLDLFSDVQSSFNEKYTKMSEDRAVMQSELRGSERAMAMMGSTNSANFEAEVATLENNLKNSCLKNTLGGSSSRDQLMSKIYDPSASNFANSNASNFLKDKLNQILDNDNTTIEKKLADLKALESQVGNRYFMKMENSYEVQDVDAEGNLVSKVVGASSNRTPSVYFSDIIRNCNAQFKANKLNNKLTGAQAIQKLRQMNQEHKALAKSQAADVKKEIRKKLIECTSPEIANNSVAGSCGPGLFNPSTPGFCANAAFSCSKNMQACGTQAENFVKEIKAQKTARVNNYKALMNKNKQDIVKIFDSALSQYMKEGEIMRGVFGAGFASPAGILREVPEGQRYLSDFATATSRSIDGKLLLEDPDKYVEMFKANIENLKKSVKAQQDQILGGESVGKNGGLLAEHIKKTQNNYNSVIKDADKTANQCLRNHDDVVRNAEQQRIQAQNENMKKMSELGEKQREYCRRFSLALGNNPTPACSGNIDDILSSLGSASYDLQVYCDGAQNSSTTSSSKGTRARKHCMSLNIPSTPAKTAWEDAEQKLNSNSDKIEKTKKLADTEKEKEGLYTKQLQELLSLSASLESEALKTQNAYLASLGPLEKSCAQLQACKTASSGRTTYPTCEDDERDAYVDTIFEYAQLTPTISAESAPYFCNAGDNSGGNVITKGMDAFNRGLGQQPGVAGWQ